jgi:hypothetical protein
MVFSKSCDSCDFHNYPTSTRCSLFSPILFEVMRDKSCFQVPMLFFIKEIYYYREDTSYAPTRCTKTPRMHTTQKIKKRKENKGPAAVFNHSQQ